MILKESNILNACSKLGMLSASSSVIKKFTRWRLMMKYLILLALTTLSVFGQSSSGKPGSSCVLSGLEYDSEPINGTITRNLAFFTIKKSGKIIGKFGFHLYSDGVREANNSESHINKFYNSCYVPSDFQENLFNRQYSNGDILSKPKAHEVEIDTIDTNDFSGIKSYGELMEELRIKEEKKEEERRRTDKLLDTDFCINDIVIDDLDKIGKILETFTNDKIKVQIRGSEFSSVKNLKDLSKSTTCYKKFCVNARLNDPSQDWGRTGVIVEVFNNGKAVVKIDGGQSFVNGGKAYLEIVDLNLKKSLGIGSECVDGACVKGRVIDLKDRWDRTGVIVEVFDNGKARVKFDRETYPTIVNIEQLGFGKD
jgi:hypothetical protein